MEITESVQRELEIIHGHEKSEKLKAPDAEPTTKDSNWIHCEVCNYKCKKEETMNKHINRKHEEIKVCPLCQKKVDSEITLTGHMERDHSQGSVNLDETLNSEDNFNMRLEQLQKEADAEYGDLSDVSLDEEWLEQLVRDMHAREGS